MKITIYHTESSVDPVATVPADMIDATLSSLEREYEAAILASFPGAEIDFRREDNTYGHEITDIDGDSYDDAMREVQEILEGVYETGAFYN
jgi:hypothetical protein